MATISIVLEEKRKNKDALCPISIYVRVGARTKITTTHMKVPKENYFDGVCTGRWRIFNQEIDKIQQAIDGIIIKVGIKMKSISLDALNSYVQKDIFGMGGLEIKEAFAQKMESLDRSNTLSMYRSTLDKICRYYDSQMLLSDFDVKMVREFEKRLICEGLKTNAISIHLRNLRAVFNYAIDEDMIDISCYPFRKFKIKKEATRKRSLTIDQIKMLRDYPCEPHQKKYIDIFMLILYLQGINIVDLCNLTEICNGRIEYKRRKTGRLYSIAVTDEAMEIIERYRGKEYLLDIMDAYGNHKDFMHRINKNLKEIGPVNRSGLGGKKHRSPLFPDLSTYWARHTWATIAAGLDIPKETIAAGLGHSTNSVTDIYIDFDMKKVDKANRMVIDAIL